MTLTGHQVSRRRTLMADCNLNQSSSNLCRVMLKKYVLLIKRKQMTAWFDIVQDTISNIPYLKNRAGSFGNIDDFVFETLHDFAGIGPYDPINVENLLYDAGIRLDRCITYRREANELAISGVKAELDYKSYSDLRSIEDESQRNALRSAQSEIEAKGFDDAANQFADSAKKAISNRWVLRPKPRQLPVRLQ
jgi:hypothetical protein